MKHYSCTGITKQSEINVLMDFALNIVSSPNSSHVYDSESISVEAGFEDPWVCAGVVDGELLLLFSVWTAWQPAWPLQARRATGTSNLLH